MKTLWLVQFSIVLSLGWLSGAVLWGQPPLALAQPETSPAIVMDARSGQPLPTANVLSDLASAQVVYLGETHDSEADHQTQLDLIRALHQLKPDLVIGMEMFQRPFQPQIDRYLAGKLTEAELVERTQYKQRWGFDWEFYAPIVRFAQQQQLSLVALNTPSEVARRVARNGLESLTLADRRFIPPRSAIVLEPDRYRQRIRQIYDEMHQGHGNSRSFERFFQVQVLWDETMAERIAQVVQQRPGALVVVLVGQGHVVYGEGIPSRVARRLSHQPQFKQRSVLLNPSPDQKQPGAGNIADYLWYSQGLPSSTKP